VAAVTGGGVLVYRVSESASLSRRGFLTARGLGASVGGLLHAVGPAERVAAAETDDRYAVANWCFARRAMACEFSVYVPPTAPNAVAAGEAALDELEPLEELLSVYRGSSAISYVNENAADRPVRVDDRLFHLLERCARLSEETGGAFDAASGALVRAWGFFRGPKHVPSEPDCLAALVCCGMQHVELDARERTVRFRVPGVELNFGAVGKGFAIDQAIRRLREDFAVECALMQGGQSSLSGLGSPSGDGRGWMIGIQNPYDPTRQVTTVRLKDCALGTSGAADQYFEWNGRRYGHVLDPRSGRPANELASASVLADDAATADALSTALFVMGLDKARDFCKDHAKIGAVLVLKPERHGGSRESPRVVTLNL
jgi:thiamine biosynthesis lipoprotein